MRRFRLLSSAVGLALLASSAFAQSITLPAPRGDEVAITRILAARHDTAAFADTGVSRQAVSDLLWASTGINRPTTGGRTSNYSYSSRDDEIYLLCAQGVFLYDQLEHLLTRLSTTDLRPTLGGTAATAPLTLALVTYNSSTDFFGSIHTGFIAQNIALACADRGLGAKLTAEIPATLASALGLASSRTILLLQSIGYPAGVAVVDPAWPVAAGAPAPAAVNDAPALKILKRRRSTRSFASTAFTTATTNNSTQILAELVWAGLGISNGTTGERTAPLIVAGAHDIDIYVAMAGGVYRYHAASGAAHSLDQVSTTDIRGNLGYSSVPAIFIYVADYATLSGVTNKQRAACLHAGLISQNVAAYAAAEGLGELVRSSVSIPTAALALTADQHILFTQTLGNMATAPAASTIAVSAGAGGTVTGTSSQSIAFGAAGTPVTAAPDTGYTFAYWSGLPGGRVPTNPLPLPNVTCAMDIVAHFVAEPTTYAAWRAAGFSGTDLTDDAISGPLADPDGTGVTNLQRYAHNLAPRGAVASPVAPGTVTDAGAAYLTLTFERRTTASDLSYVVESSSDLVTWAPVPGLSYAPGTPATVTAQDSVALNTAGTPRRFLRLRIATP
jgi:hypothetical protein